MIGYAKYSDCSKIISFKVSDEKLLKKCKKILKRVRNLMKIKFDSVPVYGDNDKYVKTKSYGDKINTNFQGKKIPKENSSYKCISLVMLEQIRNIILKHF